MKPDKRRIPTGVKTGAKPGILTDPQRTSILNDRHDSEILICKIACVVILLCAFALTILAILFLHNLQLIKTLENLS